MIGNETPTLADCMPYLRMFKPETYGIDLPRHVARVLKSHGLVEWMPPKLGAPMWAITARGRELIARP